MTNRTSKKGRSATPKEGYSSVIGADPRRGSVTKLRTIEATAEILDTSPRTVRRILDSGALPFYRIGRLVRISDADIAAFLAGNREG
jgi:excisionase family DNA binding protein